MTNSILIKLQLQSNGLEREAEPPLSRLAALVNSSQRQAARETWKLDRTLESRAGKQTATQSSSTLLSGRVHWDGNSRPTATAVANATESISRSLAATKLTFIIPLLGVLKLSGYPTQFDNGITTHGPLAS